MKEEVQKNASGLPERTNMPGPIIFMFSLVLGLVLGAGGITGFILYNGGSFVPSEVIEPRENSITEETPSPSPTELVVEEDLDNSYYLDVGKDSQLFIEDGWWISSVNSKYHILTRDESLNFISLPNNETGHFPIYRGDFIEIENGESSITIESFSDYIAGPFGFNPSPAPEGLIVIKEPTVENHGYGRIEENGMYEYYEITICKIEEMCGKYEDARVGLRRLIFKFVGLEEDLLSADKIYEESVLDNSGFSLSKKLD